MRKMDDRGFTLVEILVAIAILAVITIPLLHSFITASNTNTKSKRKLEASMAAQTLLEELKAADVDDFMYGATEATIPDGSGGTLKDSDGNEIYTLTREFERTVDGKEFRMVVTLDPSPYTTLEGEAEKNTDYNSNGYAKVTRPASSTSAMLDVGDEDKATGVKNLVLQENPGTGRDLDTVKSEIASRMSRTVRVKLETSADPESGATICTVKATISYADKSYSVTTRSDEIVYSNSMNLSNELSNIFIYFKPMYNNSAKGMPTETIIFENPDNYPVSLYLVKQTGDETGVTQVQKDNYAVNVTVSEGAGATATTLSTNLEYTEGSGMNELNLSYTGGAAAAAGSASDKLQLSAGDTGLGRSGSGNLIYHVTIDVYRKKAGGGTEVTYGNEDLLTTLEGTKE